MRGSRRGILRLRILLKRGRLLLLHPSPRALTFLARCRSMTKPSSSMTCLQTGVTDFYWNLALFLEFMIQHLSMPII